MIHSENISFTIWLLLKTKVTIVIANICGVLCAKYCSKSLYILIQLILSNNLMTHSIISPFLLNKKLGHREVK